MDASLEVKTISSDDRLDEKECDWSMYTSHVQIHAGMKRAIKFSVEQHFPHVSGNVMKVHDSHVFITLYVKNECKQSVETVIENICHLNKLDRPTNVKFTPYPTQPTTRGVYIQSTFKDGFITGDEKGEEKTPIKLLRKNSSGDLYPESDLEKEISSSPFTGKMVTLTQRAINLGTSAMVMANNSLPNVNIPLKTITLKYQRKADETIEGFKIAWDDIQKHIAKDNLQQKQNKGSYVYYPVVIQLYRSTDSSEFKYTPILYKNDEIKNNDVITVFLSENLAELAFFESNLRENLTAFSRTGSSSNDINFEMEKTKQLEILLETERERTAAVEILLETERERTKQMELQLQMLNFKK